MKYNKKHFFLAAAMLFAPATMNAQEETTDSVDLVNIAFRKVAADDILGGVSYVNMEELAKKDYTTYSIEDMSGLVSGWNGNSLWGMDTDNLDTNDSYGVLVLIDGVKRASNNVLPSEIEQITFLKGAQAVVLYGSKAAKGAILITTKRGKVDGLQITGNINTGWHVAKALPEYLGSAEYMTLYNEARANDGMSALYSQQDIYNHASGINPYRYTNINYYGDEYIRKAYNRTEATAEIQGGAQRAHFFTNISYYRFEDLINFGEARNNYTDRFNVRGNVDLVVNDFITAYANANATFYNGRSAKGNIWSAAATARPNFPQGAATLIPIDMIDPNAAGALDLISISPNIIDDKYFLGGTEANKTNDIAAGYVAGKSQFTSRQFQFDAGINFDLSGLLKGLSFKTLFAVDYATSYNTSFDNEYATYTPTWSTYGGKEVIVALTKNGEDKHSGVQNVGGTADRQTITWNGHFDYANTFGGVHNVTAMLVANLWQTTKNGAYHRYSNANIGLQATYNYDKRYYAEFGIAGVHSARLPEGNREALSPAMTLGWRLSKENFLKDTFVDDLMLSASYSILNEDIDLVKGDDSFYLYESQWDTAYAYGWNDGFSKQYTYCTVGPNPGLGFIKRKELSANLRGSFFNKLITADISVFSNDMEGYLISKPTTFPSHLLTGAWGSGQFTPVMNNDIRSRYGFDIALKAQKKFGDLYAALGVNAMYYKTKNKKVDELYEEEYRYREGHDVDAIWGLKSCGLFQSQAEIDAAPKQNLGSEVKPGDIQYVDQNGDGKIDDKDEVFLGRAGWYGHPLSMGLNLTLKYKGFTLFALATGGFGGYGIKNSSYYWVSGEQKYSAAVRDRWTPATAATATYPRLSSLNAGNNFRTSDYWMFKTDRFDLAKVQLTYDFPESIFNSSTVVKALSIYVTGQNLLTISPERKHMEMNIGSAPQTRFYNLGVKITL